MQEIMGENAVEIGQQHLRFVRRGVCCCSAVARESSLDTVALLGRFLPRLGPLPQGERPSFFSGRFFFSGLFGRSRKVSGAFLLGSTFFISTNFYQQMPLPSCAQFALLLFRRRCPIGAQFLERNLGEPIGQALELGG